MTLLRNSPKLPIHLFSVLWSVCGVGSRHENVVQLGHDVILGCVFVPVPLSGLIVEWTLREPEIRLVYSYHDGSAHEVNQHPQFRNRTELSESRLERGLASLRLRNVSVPDEGTYRCYVRSVQGKHEETLHLVVTAPYSKPEVTCFSEPWVMNLSCLARGGYPLSELQWQWVNGSHLLERARGSWAVAAGGTYELRSWLEVPAGTKGQLQCVVTNPLLNLTAKSQTVCQEGQPSQIDRRRDCTRDCGPSTDDEEKPRTRLGVTASAGSLLLLLTLLAFFQNCRLEEPRL